MLSIIIQNGSNLVDTSLIMSSGPLKVGQFSTMDYGCGIRAAACQGILLL